MSSTPSSEPQKGASDDSTRKPMPFEPVSRKATDSKPEVKKPKSNPPKSKPPKSKPAANAGSELSERPARGRPRSSRAAREDGIPEVVSRRMMKRMALFSGVPSFFGMSTFIISYWVVSQDIFALPTYAVLLVSLGWFGLGVVGLTYGVLSASWEEESLGSKLGIEFKLNWGRMTDTWKENSDREKN
jgi:Photosynthesis affected mutant 68